MTDTSTAAVTRLLENVTPGPWHVDGPLWNQIIWSSSDNRVCFMAHTSGLDDARDLATAAFIAAARDLVPALLAERDALQAEVARLSTPPDDAETAALVEAYRSCAKSLEHQPGLVAKELRRHHEATADALTRLSHALAAEKAKREAMEGELRSVEIDLFEAEDKFHIASFYITDEQTRQCVMDRVMWMAKAGRRARATLAKYGSK